MVARTMTSVDALKSREREAPFPIDRRGIVRFTVSDVMSMIDQGIVPEDATTELLDGMIVLKERGDIGGDPFMHGARHSVCVARLTALIARIHGEGRHAQIQLLVVCDDLHMPEPDFAIIRGADRDYSDHLPTAADTFVVAEVASTSLERDSGPKLASNCLPSAYPEVDVSRSAG